MVTLHVPLVAATRHLVDAARLAQMKPGAILINTARGGVVDEAAVAAALKSGRLGGAALDVFEQEPLPAGSPLAGCANLLLTPHIAGVTAESNTRVSTLIAEKVAAALAAHSGRGLTPGAPGRKGGELHGHDHARSTGRSRDARACPRRRESRDGGRDGAGAGLRRRAGPRVAWRLARAAVRDASRERTRRRRRTAAAAARQRRRRARRRPLRPRVPGLRAGGRRGDPAGARIRRRVRRRDEQPPLRRRRVSPRAGRRGGARRPRDGQLAGRHGGGGRKAAAVRHQSDRGGVPAPRRARRSSSTCRCRKSRAAS